MHNEITEKKQSQTLKIDEVQIVEEIDETPSVGRTDLDESAEYRSRSKISDPLERYSPCVEDFLARASTDKEAFDIINYLSQRNEISQEKARKLRDLIRQHGIRAFGPKRTPGYYDRFAREERLKKQMERRLVKKG